MRRSLPVGKNGFIMVPRLLLSDKRLSAEEKMTAISLAMFDMKQGRKSRGAVFPSNDTLQGIIGRSGPSIIDYKKKLIECGWLRSKRRHSKTNEYYLSIPFIQSVEDLIANFNIIDVPLTINDVCLSVYDHFNNKEIAVHSDEEYSKFELFFEALEKEGELFKQWREVQKRFLDSLPLNKRKKLMRERKERIVSEAYRRLRS